MSIADFNGDGIMDLVTANSQFFSVSLLLGIGDGSFDAPEFIPGGGFAQAVSTGDFNGDGSVDFATVNTNNDTVSVFIGDGTGDFAPLVTYVTDDGPSAIISGDFDADGIADLVTTNGAGVTGNTVSMFRGVGDGTFENQVVYAADTNCRTSDSVFLLDFSRTVWLAICLSYN